MPRAGRRGQGERERAETRRSRRIGRGRVASASTIPSARSGSCSSRTAARSPLRVFRTCRELGIATVAVAAPDDRGALHARSADETVEIACYLDSAEHIRAAREAGADAIHPGYGFLAESARLRRGRRGGRAHWVGPPPEALRAGGDKLEAKRIAARGRRARRARRGEPEELGFPLAREGGGGRRRPRHARRARRRTSSTRRSRRRAREAEAAFGDDTVFCERYLERPRHVEIQLLADAHGTVRRARRARVLGPAPPPEGARGVALPALDPALRAAMSDAAVAFARAIGYRERRHGRVRARRPRLLLPRAERPHPGRAPGDRARHGPRPRRGSSCGSPRASRSDASAHSLSRPRGRGAALRRGSAHVPPAGRAGSSGCGCPAGVRVDAGVEEGDEVGTRLRPDDREADRARPDARRGARPARRRARRDRGRGRDDEPAVPALARRAPGRARRRDDDGVPRSSTRRSPSRRCACPAAVARRVAAQPARAAAPQPPPDVDDAAHAHAAGGGESARDRADAGHGDPRRSSRRATASRRGSRSSCSRR